MISSEAMQVLLSVDGGTKSLATIDNNGKIPLSYIAEYNMKSLDSKDDVKEKKIDAQSHLERCMLLFSNTPDNAFDAVENNPLGIVKECRTNQKIREWAKTIGTLFGRYNIDPGPPFHKSSTCQVYFAKDVANENKPVVLKFMNNKDEFLREITHRYSSLDRQLDKCVASVIGWHVPSQFGNGLIFKESMKVSSSFLKIIEEKECIESIEATQKSGYPPFLLVMENGGRSVWYKMGAERVAGVEPIAVFETFYEITKKVKALHNTGLIHSDLKPRNILESSEQRGRILLCDLDAAVEIGTLRPIDLKCSTGYVPPELAWRVFGGSTELLKADASFDVWSLGILFYELCTGRHLFSIDISDDNLTSEHDQIRLCTWLRCEIEDLINIFPNESNGIGGMLKLFATYLIAHCLQGNPFDRIPINELIDKLNYSLDCVYNNIPLNTKPALVRKAAILKQQHFFISYSQSEASGDVGTLFHLFGELGIHCWRDMNATDLTEAGMKEGVRCSDCFILFLTNNTLSRRFCLYEIEWAIEFKKPIIVVVEEDNRFFSWELKRWKTDMCTKVLQDTSGVAKAMIEILKSNLKLDSGTVKDMELKLDCIFPKGLWTSDWLQIPYKKCCVEFKQVHDLIEQHCEKEIMIPFQRRQYEVAPMLRHIVRRAGELGCTWGQHVPLDRKRILNARLDLNREIYVVSHPTNGESMREKVLSKLQSIMMKKDGKLSIKFKNHATVKDSLHKFALVFLSAGISDIGEHLNALHDVVRFAPNKVIYVYSTMDGWHYDPQKCLDFKFLSEKAKEAKGDGRYKMIWNSITGHEALQYRTSKKSKETDFSYQEDSLALEILTRMKYSV